MSQDQFNTGSVIAGLATSIVVAWLARSVGTNPYQTAAGDRVLRYPRIIETIGWIGAALFAAGFVLSFRIPDDKDRTIIVSTFAGLTGLEFAMARMGRRCLIGYNNEEVYYVPIFGAPFSFRWEAVDSVRYSLLESQWVFRIANGRKARISPFMRGYKDFIRTAKRNVGVRVPDGGIYTS